MSVLNLLVGNAGVVDAAALSELTTVFTSNIGVILPVGITILGIMLGIRVIPRIIYQFF